MKKSLSLIALLLILCGCTGTLSNNKKEQKMLLIFNPTEKMLKMFRIYNPEKVGIYD